MRWVAFLSGSEWHAIPVIRLPKSGILKFSKTFVLVQRFAKNLELADFPLSIKISHKESCLARNKSGAFLIGSPRVSHSDVLFESSSPTANLIL